METSIVMMSDGVEYHQLIAELNDAREEARVHDERYQELADEDAPTEINLAVAKLRLEKATMGHRDTESERDNIDIRLSKSEKCPVHVNYTKASNKLGGARSVLRAHEGSLTTAQEEVSDVEIFAAMENRSKDFRVAEERLAAT